MLFFPVVLVVYFVIPKKLRYIWLLAASYCFYMGWNPKYALLIAFSTAVTYLSGILLDKVNENRKSGKTAGKQRRIIVAASFIINIGILIFFKYFDFILENVNAVLGVLGIAVVDKPFDIVLPVGISFYTFQALSYTMDVYRGEIKAEKNLLRYVLFVSFFPQLVAGPIERSKNLLKQIQNVEQIHLWNYKRITQGAVLMLWGYFQKMVIADRAAILVDQVYDSYWSYGGIELILATILFAVQIYCDFASYSQIAIGAAKIMGFELMENFNTPYFACSIQDFWRRWHISLSTWLRDYLYIPLGGSRCSKPKKYRNIMITFLTSGLWHGASWNYIVWGGLHGVYQIVGDMLRPAKKKFNSRFHVKTKSFSYKLGKIFVTFVLVDFAWIFFRADSMHDSIQMIERILTRWDPWVLFDQSLYTLGLNQQEMHILFAAVLLLLFVDIVRFRYKETIDVFLEKQCLWFRWGMIFLFLLFILIFGIYGPTFDAKQFIYFQF